LEILPIVLIKGEMQIIVIYKYEIKLSEDNSFSTKIHEGYRILKVALQKKYSEEKICVWAEVNTENHEVAVKFRVHPTGQMLPRDYSQFKYLETVFPENGLVWHIYISLIDTNPEINFDYTNKKTTSLFNALVRYQDDKYIPMISLVKGLILNQKNIKYHFLVSHYRLQVWSLDGSCQGPCFEIIADSADGLGDIQPFYEDIDSYIVRIYNSEFPSSGKEQINTRSQIIELLSNEEL
jgi:hypothetical protein